MFQGRLRGDSRVSKRSSKGVKREFEGSFKDVLRESVSVCQENLKKASRVFQKCFNEVLFDEVSVAWISSQLPEQKEACFLLVSNNKKYIVVEFVFGKQLKYILV